jgi:hypothetical protein
MGWQVMATSKKRTPTPLPLNGNAGSSWTRMKRVLLTFLLRIRDVVSPVNIALFSLLNLDTPGVEDDEEEDGAEDEDQGHAEDEGMKMPKVIHPAL